MDVLAHGVGGGRSDLPLPAWLFSYGAGFAVLISFVALGIFWPRPRLAAAAPGRELPGAVQSARRPATWVLRTIGVVVYAVVVAATLFGVDESGSNFGPYAFYIAFWVGVPVLATLFGDVYRALNPLDTLATVVFGRRLPARTARRERSDPGLWPAAVMVFAFVWMELAYHSQDSPRAVGVWLVAYTVAALAGTALWGRDWIRDGEGFAALFALLGRIGIFHRDEETGRLRVRWPVAGLAAVRPVRGLDALVLVTLGSTTFDGVTRLDWWSRDVVGRRGDWEATAVHTVGLLLTICVVALVWTLATRISARITGDDPHEVADAYVASLAPIVFAYAVAHYFSYFVYEMYNTIALASDPFGEGWDLFGTIDWVPNYRLLSPDLIAWVQTGAIVVGHVAGVLVAHDRAVERHDLRLASRSQWPIVAAMVGYTVAGLGLLLGA